MSEHAFLSASSSEIWINCPASPHATKHVEDKETEFSREGSFGHSMVEAMLLTGLTDVNDLPPSGVKYDTPEIRAAVQKCVDYASGLIGEGCKVWIEERVDYSHIAPEGFGTSDLMVYHPDEMHLDVVDWKFGKGVAVSAKENSQERLYAEGAVELLVMNGYEVKTIRTHIVQPRLSDEPNTEDLTCAELRAWAASIATVARIAFHGTGDYVPGEHCRWCKIRKTCVPRAEFFQKQLSTELACELNDDILLAAPAVLGLQWVAEKLSILRVIAGWIEDIEKYALESAVEGKDLPGMKLVEGRSTRRFKDVAGAIRLLRNAGVADEKIFKEPELRSLGDLETACGGKNAFNLLLEGVIEKPPGKPVLVPDSDKRPAIKTLPSAADLGD